MKQKVAIYLRVSKKDMEEENQLPDCEAYARQLGFTEWDLIQEKISAFKNPDRKSMENLLNYDVVIIWAYDRLQRNRKKFLEMMQLYGAKQTRIYSYRQKWMEELHKVPVPWNDILYNMMLELYGWMAEDESQHRSERTKAGLKKAKAKGVQLGRRVSQIDFKKVWKEYKAQGSINKASKVLPYSYGTVHKIITNEIKTQEAWGNLSKKDT